MKRRQTSTSTPSRDSSVPTELYGPPVVEDWLSVVEVAELYAGSGGWPDTPVSRGWQIARRRQVDARWAWLKANRPELCERAAWRERAELFGPAGRPRWRGPPSRPGGGARRP